jgi:hypothetical protein
VGTPSLDITPSSYSTYIYIYIYINYVCQNNMSNFLPVFVQQEIPLLFHDNATCIYKLDLR